MLVRGITHGVGGVAAEVLVGEEEHLYRFPLPLGQSPFEHFAGVGTGADSAAVLADESFDRGGRIHVGDGDQSLARTGFLKLGPAFEGLIEVGHVGHRAASAQIRQDYVHIRGGEDVGGLGHEMHTTEDDILGIFLGGGVAGKFKGVARKVGEVDDVILLVVMAEDDELFAKFLPGPR